MTATARPEAQSARQAALFRRFLLARTVSWAGQWMTVVALPILMYQRTGSAALTGLLTTLEAVPYLLLGLPVGAWADRWDRRRTMTLTRTLSGLVVASVPVASALGVLSTAQLLLVAVGISTLFVFDDAAGFGALPEIVGRGRLSSAFATMSTVSTVLGLIAPAVAGVLVTTVGPAQLLALDATAYVVSALLLSRLRWEQAPTRQDGAAGPGWRRTAGDVKEGLHFLWGHPVVRALTVMGTGLSITMGAVTGLLVVHGVEHLDLAEDDSRLGLLYVATSLGALAVSLLLPRLQARVPTGALTLSAGVVNVLALLVWSHSTALLVGLASLVIWQGAATLATLNGIVVRQAVTPDRLQSRVNTTARMIAWGGTPLGAGAGGLVAQAYGTPAALTLASVGVLASLCLGLAMRAHRFPTLGELVEQAACADPPNPLVSPSA